MQFFDTTHVVIMAQTIFRGAAAILNFMDNVFFRKQTQCAEYR